MTGKRTCIQICPKRKYKRNMNIQRYFACESEMETAEMEDDEQVRFLINELLEYAEWLCDEIVYLRKEINRLDRELYYLKNHYMSGYQKPYIDLISDIYKSFYGVTGYEKFKEEFEETSFA